MLPITIFTPTYNRAHLLPRVYESLCGLDLNFRSARRDACQSKNVDSDSDPDSDVDLFIGLNIATKNSQSQCQSQSLKESKSKFEWLIVDDGSTDNTREVVEEICSKHTAPFAIRYIYKRNGGKHTAVNVGVQEAKGELFFILDSDDYLPSDALKIVAEEWAKVRDVDFDFDSDSDHDLCLIKRKRSKSKSTSKSRSNSKSKFAGVAGLDCFADGRTVGNGLPCDSIDCNAMDIRYKYHVTGDMKEVFRTDVLKEYPFPEIEGERFCPEQLVWFRIAQKYKLHFFNKPIYIAEYQEGGITAGITRARMKSPIATMMCYAELNSYDVPFKQKIKAAINYWRFRFCAKGGKYPTINPLWSFVIPLAFVMHLRDRRRI